MTTKEPLVGFDEFDENKIISDAAAIDSYIPQRHEMRQLDAIIFECEETMRCVGYKDLKDDEFWVNGHFPGSPLMPGVVACECACQVSAYYASKFKLVDGTMGLGSLDSVKFRGPMRPGDRLIMMIARRKYRPNMLFNCQFQIFIDKELVVDGVIKGVPLPEGFI